MTYDCAGRHGNCNCCQRTGLGGTYEQLPSTTRKRWRTLGFIEDLLQRTWSNCRALRRPSTQPEVFCNMMAGDRRARCQIPCTDCLIPKDTPRFPLPGTVRTAVAFFSQAPIRSATLLPKERRWRDGNIERSLSTMCAPPSTTS